MQTNFPEIEINNHCDYTIEQNASLKEFKVHLFSIYNVTRTTAYTAKKDRPNEPRTLYAFIRTTKGTGEIVTAKKTYALKENTLFLFDVNEIVKYYSVGGAWTYHWYNFTPVSEIPFFKTKQEYYIPFNIDEEKTHQSFFDYYQDFTPISYQLTNSSFINLIYNWIHTLQLMNVQKKEHVSDIKRVIYYINENLDKELQIKELASFCYISERQFRNIFHSYMGMSPKEYICNQRLNTVAYKLKTTTYSIKHISYLYHYSTPYQLSRAFKKKFGVSPKEYRKMSTPPHSL